MSIDNATPQQWDAAWKAAMQGNKPVAPTPAPTPTPKTTAPVDFKANQGISKPKLDLVPLSAMTYMALGLQEGARKYGSGSWREAGQVDLSQYVGAAMRHLMAYADGEDTDPESGNPHIAHALASLAIMADLIESGNGADTRPVVAGPGPEALAKYTKVAR